MSTGHSKVTAHAPSRHHDGDGACPELDEGLESTEEEAMGELLAQTVAA